MREEWWPMVTWRTQIRMFGTEVTTKRVCMLAVAAASLAGVAAPRALLARTSKGTVTARRGEDERSRRRWRLSGYPARRR